MRIAVYCGASKGNLPIYQESARRLGQWIGEHHYECVYGGGNVGLMGILADTLIEYDVSVTGVMPRFLIEREIAHPRLHQLIAVETMSERKNKMIELADVYIALPGGPGTLEEISEVISLGRLGQHHNPCILLNINHFYTPLEEQFKGMVRDGFLTEEDQRGALFAQSADQLDELIASFRPLQQRKY